MDFSMGMRLGAFRRGGVTVEQVLDALGATGRLWLLTQEAYTDSGGTTAAGVGDAVARVTDLGPNGDHMVAEAGAGTLPTIVSRPYGASLQADGVNDDIRVPFSPTIAQPCTIILAVEQIGGDENWWWRDEVSAAGIIVQARGGGQVVIGAGVSAGRAEPPIPRGPVIIHAEVNGASSRVWVNNKGPYPTNDVGTRPANGIAFGTSGAGTSFKLTRGSAIAFAGKLLSDAERSTLFSFMRAQLRLDYGPRDRSQFAPSVSEAIIIASTAGEAGVTVPSYFPCVVDISQDADFDGVENAAGERLNYLMYTSTDHAGADAAAGIYLTLGFGDPITGTWKRYDAALADGDLDAYTGSKPAATGGKIFNDAKETETPWVGKVGSTWVMTYHPQDTSAPGVQRTKRASSTSPFGAFTITDIPDDADDIFLPAANIVNHTGYAVWGPMPEWSSLEGSYWIRSLYVGGGGSRTAIWTADENMLNPVLVSGNIQITEPAGQVIPDYEYDSGEQLRVAYAANPSMFRSGGKTYTLTSANSEGAGGVLRTSVAAAIEVGDDLQTVVGTPSLVLAANDLWDFVNGDGTGIGISAVGGGQIVARPGGGHAYFVPAQGDVADGEEYVFVMPITVNV